jgi:predicted transglutaminase-like cysteine proteinase
MIKSRYRAIQALAIIFTTLLLPGLLIAAGIDFSPGLLRYINNRWGDEGQKRVQSWNHFIISQPSLSKSLSNTMQIERNELSADNIFWNRVPFISDKAHWGIDDYWATPVEMLGSNGGDCEDYSIGKYFTLKKLGIPVQKLRIVYVRALSRNEPHMVLAYYPEPDADPLILDNLTNEILPASKRTDLDPIFSFNDDDLWSEEGKQHKQNRSSSIFSFNDELWLEGNQLRTGQSSQIRLWRNLLEKMAIEQRL